jgi:isopenicillin N synthase-like dioxygenase
MVSLLMRFADSADVPLDYLTSTLHRVTLPHEDDRYTGEFRMTRAIYSIPYFVSPDSDSVVACIPECKSESNPPKYNPVVQRDYQRMRAKLQY